MHNKTHAICTQIIFYLKFHTSYIIFIPYDFMLNSDCKTYYFN